jgi:hypothetical protein
MRWISSSIAWLLPRRSERRRERSALDVEHVVVREHVFASVEIELFDARLRFFERARDHRIVDRFVFRNFERAHHALDHVGRKDAHQRIFERDEKLRLARIALATGAAAQLIVDARARDARYRARKARRDF